MRSWNSLKNMITGFGGEILNMLLNFAVRTVFIYTLSKAYTGINGLFSSILTVLSLSELGLGGAIGFAMYKPIAENDTEMLKTLMRFYRKAYRVIGFVFFGLGLLLLPVLPWLLKGTTDLVNVRMVYVLYILDIALSYWFFAYKGAILNASQKSYMVTMVNYVGSIVTAGARLLMLFLLRGNPALSFYCYTVVGILGNVLKNWLVKRRVDRIFPWLLDKNVRPMDENTRRDIMKNVVGMSANKVCMVLNDGIDSTILSAFLGVVAVGIFSNYLLLRSYVNKFLSTAFGALSASVGNLCAVESREKKEEFFHSLQLSYFWIYGFCAICLWILYDPFIAGVWLDESWLLTKLDVFLLSANFLIEGVAGAVVKYRDASGLFWQTRYRYILSSLLNVVLSVVLVGPLGMGVSGALLGTTVSLLVMLSRDPVLVYRTVFEKKAGAFYRMYLGYLLLAAATGGLVWLLTLPFSEYTFVNCVIKLGICIAVPNGLWFCLFRKRPEFLYLKNTALSLGRKLLRR